MAGCQTEREGWKVSWRMRKLCSMPREKCIVRLHKAMRRCASPGRGSAAQHVPGKGRLQAGRELHRRLRAGGGLVVG